MFFDLEAKLICSFPPPDSPLMAGGQVAFVVRFPSMHESVSPSEIKEYLGERLPRYMQPARIEVLPQLPITSEGNLDREQLKARSVKQSIEVVSSNDFEYDDDLESRMAQIWAEILNLEAISRADNFFALGGDSLLLAQVISKIRKTVPEARNWDWEELGRELNREPTIASLCEKLRSRIKSDESTPASVNRKKPLVVLAQGKDNHRSLKAVFHTGNGNLTPYRHLLDHMIRNEKRVAMIVGFVVTDTKEFLSIPANRMFETLGQRYAQELIDLHVPQIDLIGYCTGGLIAVETARILYESGIEKCTLSLISTDPLNYQLKDHLLLERAFAKMIGVPLANLGHVTDETLLQEGIEENFHKKGRVIPEGFLCGLTGRYQSIAENYKRLEKKTHMERMTDLAAELSVNKEKISPDMLEMFYKMFCHSLDGAALYHPLPLMDDITLFRVMDESSHFLPGLRSFSLEFWQNLIIGELRIKDIQGNHFSCVTPPHAQKLVNYLHEGGL